MTLGSRRPIIGAVLGNAVGVCYFVLSEPRPHEWQALVGFCTVIFGLLIAPGITAAFSDNRSMRTGQSPIFWVDLWVALDFVRKHMQYPVQVPISDIWLLWPWPITGSLCGCISSGIALFIENRIHTYKAL